MIANDLEIIEMQGALNMTSEQMKRKVKLELWDTAGQARYESLRPLYFRGAWVVFLVFDVTNRSSFESLPSQVAMDGLNDDT